MYVLVRKPFAIPGHMFDRGDTLLVFAELADELPDLIREGVVVVIEDDRDPIQLATPESGQALTLR